MFGAEIFAPNGTKFTMFDRNPYVFWNKYRIDTYSTGIFRLNGIPLDNYPMVFYSGDRASTGPVTKKDGSGWFLDCTSNDRYINVWVFVNRELKPTTQPYGIIFYGPNGEVAMDGGSKPLKAYEASFGNLDFPHPIAILAHVERVDIRQVGQVVCIATYAAPTGNSIRAQEKSLGFGGGGVGTVLYKSDSKVLYINTNEY